MSDDKNKINSVSVVIPVYNGADTVEELVERLISVLVEMSVWECLKML